MAEGWCKRVWRGSCCADPLFDTGCSRALPAICKRQRPTPPQQRARTAAQPTQQRRARLQGGDDWEAAHKLWDEAVGDEVALLHLHAHARTGGGQHKEGKM